MSGIDEVRGAIHGDGYLLGRPLADDEAAAFQARHDRLSGTYVVRLFPPEVQARTDVQNEARRASLIRHPGIAQVLDFNVSGEEPVFVVTENVEGRSLDQVIAEEGMLPLPRAIELVEQIADALRAAHALGIVHGDLHPGIIRLAEGPNGKVSSKVLGFGWARELHAGDRRGKSWIYLPPELQAVVRRPADERADQFSLAAITYEMLAGCPPFADDSSDEEEDDDSDRTNPGFTTFRPPPRLSEFVMGLPAGIDGVLGRAFSPEARERYPRLEDFTAALRQVAGMKPAAAPVIGDPDATPPPVAAPAKPSMATTTATTAQVAADPDATPPPVKKVTSSILPPPVALSKPIQLGFLGSALLLVIGSIIVMAQTQKKVPPQHVVAPILSTTTSQVDFVPAPPAPRTIPRPAEPPPAVSSEESAASHRHTRRGAHRAGGGR